MPEPSDYQEIADDLSYAIADEVTDEDAYDTLSLIAELLEDADKARND